MYRYETHLHTSPVSRCARADVRESLEFYKNLGYDGVFITNHFLDGNINVDRDKPYAEKIEFYFSDYEEGVRIGEELGIKVFCGVELSYKGTDFLVYGLDKAWFLAHPEIMEMKKTEELAFMMEQGALVIQAHPFREAVYIDHIRLFPRFIHGVEIYNANRTEFENRLAEQYCDNYGLVPFAGSDNHQGGSQKLFGGMATETPLMNERDFIDRIKRGEGKPFARNAEDGSVRYL
jgi:histidinol phosphatase-like PHP family hydrolase